MCKCAFAIGLEQRGDEVGGACALGKPNHAVDAAGGKNGAGDGFEAAFDSGVAGPAGFAFPPAEGVVGDEGGVGGGCVAGDVGW